MKYRLILFVLFAIFYQSIAQKSQLPKTVVYSYDENSDNKFGYRIPSLVTTHNGTLLAIAEQRIGLHDHAQNDIVLRRSEDNGKTWSDIHVIHEDGKNSLNDPCAVVLSSGRILLMFQRYPYLVHSRTDGNIQIADTGYDGPRNTKSFITFSDDDGRSWSTPREISKQVRPSERISIGSPGIGIQLTLGAHKGRVIMPLYETKKISENTRVWGNSVAFSDDDGETWHISNEIPHYDHTGYGNEAQVVEQSDGGIMIIARNQGGVFRKYAESKDGGQTWTNMRLNLELPGVACQGSVLRIQYGEGEQNIIAHVNAADFKFRTKGVVRLSFDDGLTWPVAKKIPAGQFAYSCLTKLKNGKIGLLYETAHYREIAFTSFDLDWIMDEDPIDVKPYYSIPFIDLDKDGKRQVIVDKEEGQYLGHVTTALMEDGKTIYAVYPKGHGKGAIVMKRSDDGGISWSERLPTPDSWKTSQEVPTLFKVEDANGIKRLIMFSGLYPTRMAISEDEGLTWSELNKVGDWGGIVVMGDIIPLTTGKGHYMALFHDDLRFIHKDGKRAYKKDVANFNSRTFSLYKSLSYDGGLTWSAPDEIL
ncbi:MAG: exo-alpha-sialidase, partial [Cyclobacteriaceae bacterium]|nr:exo-alpha-sialidase [Cyclobacteriaceae bacterium]